MQIDGSYALQIVRYDLDMQRTDVFTAREHNKRDKQGNKSTPLVMSLIFSDVSRHGKQCIW